MDEGDRLLPPADQRPDEDAERKEGRDHQQSEAEDFEGMERMHSDSKITTASSSSADAAARAAAPSTCPTRSQPAHRRQCQFLDGSQFVVPGGVDAALQL